MGAKGSVEAAKINAQNWNNLEVGRRPHVSCTRRAGTLPPRKSGLFRPVLPEFRPSGFSARCVFGPEVTSSAGILPIDALPLPLHPDDHGC
ncbi:hypothetical protein Zmor_013041 [Zophobas morio]|uniref:Uncharacterized protein n=1 Tax=Zophobas morio TaxID=2755281 RepID=A0AA38IEX6_9CUCU|nr:hypothetical protein Zmor_013041 [Zophobas morio]